MNCLDFKVKEIFAQSNITKSDLYACYSNSKFLAYLQEKSLKLLPSFIIFCCIHTSASQFAKKITEIIN